MAVVPDKNWSDLITGLGDNNTGAITETDVRAIAGYFRQSTAKQVVTKALPLQSLGWKTLPSPEEDIRILRLQEAVQGVAGSSWSASTGALSVVANGVSYNIGDLNADGSTYDREFTINWSIAIESQHNTSWGISIWKLDDGATWPTGAASWPGSGATWADSGDITLEHIELFDPAYDVGASDGGTTYWTARSAGSATVRLSPGDTLVPVIEYYGTKDSGVMSSPVGDVKTYTMTVSTIGSVTDNLSNNSAQPAGAPNLGAAPVRATGRSVTNTSQPGSQMETIRFMNERPSSGMYLNMTVFETKVGGKLCIYDGSAWVTFTRD